MRFNFLHKFCSLFLLLATAGVSLYAQFENMWVFGANFGLDFNAGTPPKAFSTPFGSQASTFYSNTGTYGHFWGSEETSASISDEEGKLLFYTSGERVWDRRGNIMPNGDSIVRIFRLDTVGRNGNNYNVSIRDAVSSSAQGALIVPFPNDPQKYYVFSLTASDGILGRSAGHLYYHVVDMSLNGGFGDVVSGQKRIFVDSGFTEQMTSVAGDKCNIWVIVSTLYPTEAGVEFKAFEINAQGVQASPVISHVGTSPGHFFRGSNICVSPDRRRLVATRDNVVSGSAELYDFNPATGRVSNQLLLIPNSNTGCYGASFSSDNNKLYISRVLLGGIYQYDLSSNNGPSIVASETKISNAPMSGLKLAPDGKIYYKSGVRASYALILGTINFPNLPGAASMPNDTALKFDTRDTILIGGERKPIVRSMDLGFPNVVSKIIRQNISTVTDTLICAENVLIQSPLEDAQYLWDDGSANATQTVVSSGTYWVQSTNYCYDRKDTFQVEIGERLNPLILVKDFDLSAGGAGQYERYQWLLNGEVIPGATDSSYFVKENGDYQVVVWGSKGCSDTSGVYRVSNVAINNIALLSKIVGIYPNPAKNQLVVQSPVPVCIRIWSIDGKMIKEVKQSAAIALNGIPAGMYKLDIIDQQGQILKVEKLIKMP